MTLAGKAVVSFLVALAASAHAAPSTAPATQPAQGAPAPELRQKLAQRLPEINLKAIPLGDVMEFLENQKLNVFVNWRSLERRRISRSTPVTLTMRDRPLAEVIDAVLATLDAQGKERVVWSASENFVVVALATDLPHHELIKQRMSVRRWDDATARALAQRTDVRFNATALSQCFAELREQTGLVVEGDWPALAEAGVDEHTQQSFTATQATVAEIMALVLFDLDPKGRLALAPRGGKAVVTLREPIPRQ